MSEQLSFRLCTMADKPALVAFMDTHWGSKHPLLHCEDFFSYYYVSEPACDTSDTMMQANSSDKPLQFAIAEENGQIVAIAGYILSAHSEPRDIWVSLWCAVKGKNGAGLELMAALPSLTGARVMSCNNIRPKTMAFYTFLGYTAARIPHFYRLADKPLGEYAVARIQAGGKRILPAQGGASLTPVRDKETILRDFTPNPALRPHKDAWYVARRYFSFPRLSYDVYAVCPAPCEPAPNAMPQSGETQSDSNTQNSSGAQREHAVSALLVTRTVPVNGTAVLRIVDYIGAPEGFAALGKAIDALLQAAGAEYAECYCYGIGPEIFAAAGFCERTADDGNIIPNYLTPPLYENTDYYFFTSDPDHFTMFKADGDQDKPNLAVE